MTTRKVTVRRKKKVFAFLLQGTKSFRDGAPQREMYESDATYFLAEAKYDAEWRAKYECRGCGDVGCPQCGAKR